MSWIVFALASGVLNALWTSRIKPRVQTGGASAFTAGIRWGVAFLLLPFALKGLRFFPASWWIATSLSGILESLSLLFLTHGIRRDYYATYSISNTSPLFVVLLAFLLLSESLGGFLLFGAVLTVAGALFLYYRGHGSWWGLASALAVSLSKILSKAVINDGNPMTQACVAFACGAAFLTLVSLSERKSGTTAVIFKGIWTHKILVLLSTLTTVCFYEAVSLGPIGPITILSRVNLIVGFGLSYYGLKERRDWKGRLLGASMILLGIVLVIWKH